jgi:hypothetical protein
VTATTDQILEWLAELTALERLAAILTTQPLERPEWQYARVAIEDRLLFVKFCLRREDQALRADVQARDHEAHQALVTPAAVVPEDLLKTVSR